MKENCPKFDKCSATVCLLDPDMKYRTNLPGDEKCKLSKTKRIKLGVDLPWYGLTTKELASKKKWDLLPESEKEAIRVRGRQLFQNQREKRLRNSV